MYNFMAKKILIVDDNAGILESLQFLLKAAGYEVVTSEDGRICHRNFNGHRPDVILLDYWLPR